MRARQALRVVVVAVTFAVTSLAAFSSPARSSETSHWYWTPAACKAELQNRGVAISDGRTYNVAKAYCVGLHDHCWLNNGLRRYKVFIAVMRSYDGVVRRFVLTVTGKNTWTGSPVRIIDSYMTASQFEATYGPAAWSVAEQENAAGCWDVHP